MPSSAIGAVLAVALAATTSQPGGGAVRDTALAALGPGESLHQSATAALPGSTESIGETVQGALAPAAHGSCGSPSPG